MEVRDHTIRVVCLVTLMDQPIAAPPDIARNNQHAIRGVSLLKRRLLQVAKSTLASMCRAL
jgi:hypothetical protein